MKKIIRNELIKLGFEPDQKLNNLETFINYEKQEYSIDLYKDGSFDLELESPKDFITIVEFEADEIEIFKKLWPIMLRTE